MRWISIVFIFGLCFATRSQSFESTFRSIDGEEVSLDELSGSKLVVVDFWATWCKPCVKSIPKLVELSQNFDEEEVSFVGINVDSPRNLAKVRPFAYSLGVPYPILLDTEQTLYDEYLVSSLPTLIILSNDGDVLYTHEGYTAGDEKLIEKEIKSFL